MTQVGSAGPPPQAKTGVDVPAFLIVGTPRSGTTLVQRLACELPGVRVPPETHFFSLFAPALLRRRRFPLDGPAVREEAEAYGALQASRGMATFDAGAVADDLGGRCDSLVELYGAVIRHLAGPAEVHGEKTPTHLLWWRPLARALPRLKVVAVVRDPRGVVASNLDVPWGMGDHAVLAQRWASDQRHVAAAEEELGQDRCLVMRYEEVVVDAASARLRLARFLGLASSPGRAGEKIFLPHETWKAQALGPVTTDGVDSWRASLTAAQAADVAALCRPQMRHFDYLDDVPPAFGAALRLVRLAPPRQWRRLHFSLERHRTMARIRRATLG